MTSEIRGQLERVTYTNEENGYTVARVRMDGHPELVTVVGNLLSPVPGEVLHMQGEWVEHPRFGRQFKIEHSRSVFPASAYGIQKYLGSGLVRGIGPALAKRIVARFGERTLEVIEERIEALAEVEGIGEKRIAMIGRAWEEQKEIREVMVFLQAHEVSAAYAARIFKRYGQRSIEVVRQNPYRLSADIFGIGFLTADRIAARLGFAPDSPLRAEAGILHVLQELAGEGHVYCPHEPLVERCREVLAIDAAVVLQALEGAERERRVVVDDLHSAPGESLANDKGVYLAQFHVCECGIAESFGRLLAAPRAIREINAPKAIEWVQRRLAIRLADRQRDAVGCALTSKVMVITGGPGTGKTTIIHAILEIVAQLRVRILLAAPTGRAAKRMTEATGREARTIHRLLEYSLQKGGFQRNSDRPLECDLLIVDEASMMDTVLFHHLLKALPAGAALILVGDVNQLPSVGAGNVLGDIIASATVPVIELTEIFRQARESLIVMNAHRINAGRMPELKPAGPSGDFYFIEQEDPEEVLKLVLELAGERVPRHFDLDPLDGVQVLTPMHRGTVGAANLNAGCRRPSTPGRRAWCGAPGSSA